MHKTNTFKENFCGNICCYCSQSLLLIILYKNCFSGLEAKSREQAKISITRARSYSICYHCIKFEYTRVGCRTIATAVYVRTIWTNVLLFDVAQLPHNLLQLRWHRKSYITQISGVSSRWSFYFSPNRVATRHFWLDELSMWLWQRFEASIAYRRAAVNYAAWLTADKKQIHLQYVNNWAIPRYRDDDDKLL
jgi:hypothetical protein